MVNPDPHHVLFSQPPSYRTSRLPSTTNNNKTAKSSPFLLQYSRKSLFSRSSNTLPPLAPGQTRSRRGRVRTVPSSRANSSKLSRLELEPVLGKRSRSASEEPNYTQVSHSPTNHALEIRGSETGLQSPTKEENHHHHHHHHSRPRRLTKVETVRVLRARSALLLPLPSPSIPSHPPAMQVQPLVLKSEERKKKRR